MMKRNLLATTAVLLVGLSGRSQGGIVASNTARTLFNTSSAIIGQSFTTAAGPAQTTIVFNFFSDFPATTPYALGTGCRLSQEYLGLPRNSSLSPLGSLGQATAAGGITASARR
jgi:hypothetical protein